MPRPSSAARSCRWATSSGSCARGYLADLLLVDGDPSADVRVLQERDRIVAIMKGGSFHKAPSADAMMRAGAST